MSADADFTMTTPALLKAADHFAPCPTFHVGEGESRHGCTICGASETAHIIVALRTAYRTVVQAVTAPSEFPNESDWDEEHKRRPAKMTSNERQQGMVDRGEEDWLNDEQGERDDR